MSILEKIKKGWSKFWNETLGPDYSTAELAELNIESTDKVEAALAKSSAEIDAAVQNYGNTSKAKRRELLKNVEVKKDQLGKNPEPKVKDDEAKAPRVETKQQGRGRDD